MELKTNFPSICRRKKFCNLAPVRRALKSDKQSVTGPTVTKCGRRYRVVTGTSLRAFPPPYRRLRTTTDYVALYNVPSGKCTVHEEVVAHSWVRATGAEKYLPSTYLCRVIVISLSMFLLSFILLYYTISDKISFSDFVN